MGKGTLSCCLVLTSTLPSFIVVSVHNITVGHRTGHIPGEALIWPSTDCSALTNWLVNYVFIVTCIHNPCKYNIIHEAA